MSLLEPISAAGRRADEAKFEIDEMFFSRTDERGIIESGNEVFQRISEYSWDELKGAPHKIIRDPDMPKGVFHLMWERLKEGKPTGTYVKNKTKSGKYYWVFAIVSPIEGGFVSARIKPSSELFAHIPALYAKLRKAEQEEGVSAEQSAQSLMSELAAHGYESYDAFNADAAAKEVAARDKLLDQTVDYSLRTLLAIVPLLEELKKEQQELFAAFAGIQGIPSNMRIVASRLEPAGGPISAISLNYRLMADEVTNEIEGLQKEIGDEAQGTSISAAILNTLFAMSTVRVQSTLVKKFEFEQFESEDSDSKKDDAKVLKSLADQYTRASSQDLTKTCADIDQLTRRAKDLRQLVTGLDSIRVLCRVEAGRLGSGSDALLPVINQLDRTHVKIDNNLAQILDLTERIVDHAKQVIPKRSSFQ